MTFKPGMHQIVENKCVDFDAIIAKMAGAQPQVTFPMMGWGKKFFIKATLKRKTGERVEIEFFTELTFPEVPTNRETGYTADDSRIFQGVQILDFEPEADSDNYHANHGEILAYEDFVTRFVHDSTTRVTLERVMDDMKARMVINDQTIERINDAWGNRDPGEGVLYSVQYQ